LTVASRAVLGRAEELATIGAFLASPEGGAHVLVVRGEAGIGKTTLLRAAIGLAASGAMTVLQASPSEGERGQPYLVLQDLFRGLDPVHLVPLPGVQRAAIDAVRLVAPPPRGGLDPRTTMTATLGVLSSLAASAPLVIAIDDIHWMDAETRAALVFAIRRLQGPNRACFLFALREDQADDIEVVGIRSQLEELVVPPIAADDIDALLRDQIGSAFPRPQLARIIAWSRGNPMLAIEIGRRISQSADARTDADAIPPLDPSLSAAAIATLLDLRLNGQPAAVRDALLVIALAGRLNSTALTRVARRLGRALALPPSGEHLLQTADDGELRIAHPLLAAKLIARAPSVERQRIHAALAAEMADRVAAARHAAMATDKPDEPTAALLVDAADEADRRGAPETALELRQLALERSDANAAATLQARRLAIGLLAARLGDGRRAEPALQAAAVGPDDAAAVQAFVRLLQIRIDAPATDTDAIVRAARRRAGNAVMLAEVALAIPAPLPARYRHARAADRLARRAGDDDLAVRAAGRAAALAFQLGIPFSSAALDEAAAREVRTPGFQVRGSAGHLRAWIRVFEDDYDRSRQELHGVLATAEAVGDEASVSALRREIAHLEIRAGRWLDSEHLANAAMLSADRAEQPLERAMAHLLLGAVASLRGERAVAEEELAAATELGDANGDPAPGGLAAGRLGAMYLSFGLLEESAAAFARSRSQLAAAGWMEPALTNWRGDDAHVLVLLGRAADAERLVDELERSIGSRPRPVSRAAMLRARASTVAAAGDTSAGAQLADASVEQLRSLQDPFQLARSLHVAGSLARRDRHKAKAAALLAEAAAILASLGARAWEANAREELARVGLRPRAPSELTDTELVVAELAAAGNTNRQVGERASLSPRTVEAVLARAYAKLGVASRAELGRAMAELEGTTRRRRQAGD
jgi:DNA-binding CsgD family transcriptional regulator